MFDIGTKFRYFHGILKEVYQIIEINFEMKDSDIDKLLRIIDRHLQKYNKKGGMVSMGMAYQRETSELSIYLYDYVRGRGRKKLFSDTISITSVMRDMIVDMLLSDDLDINDYK